MQGVPMRRLVWDVPTRLFHWALVALIGFSWWSAATFHMDWHGIAGLAVCGLLVFRVCWGIWGTSTSRFRHFVKGPRAVRAYLRPQGGTHPTPPLGHNPLGGWSVLALLAVLIAQVTSGLFAVDVDGIESGPLSFLVTFDQGRLASRVHGLSFDVLKVLVVLHVAAILFYLFARRRNLTWVMITGAEVATERDGSGATRAARWGLAVALSIAVLLACWLGNGLAL